MKLKRCSGNKSGQSLVETALVLPIIILVLLGIIDFGLLFNNYIVITNASREASRSAAVGLSDSDISLMVGNLTTTLDQTLLTVTISPSETTRKKGDEVSVTVEFDNNLLTPLISAIVPNPVHLTARTIMRVE